MVLRPACLKGEDRKGWVLAFDPDANTFRKIKIGCLLWPARNCYPAISYAVAELSRFVKRPSMGSGQGELTCFKRRSLGV